MLKDILNENRIKTDVYCSSWQEACKEVGQILVDNGDIKKEFVDSMIETVNKFGPYMILLPEVCLFHGTPGDLVNRASLSLITLKEPVYFTEYENQKITCALGFAAVDSEGHLKMLTELAKLLQDEEFLNLVRNNGSLDKILDRIKEY